MTLRRVMGLMIGLPLACFFALWLCYRFYVPESSGPVSFGEKEFRYYGADGRGIDGTLSVPPPVRAPNTDPAARLGRETKYVLLVSDRGLDRDWNSGGVYFRTGARLARFWASHGTAVVRYDARGTGRESGRRRQFSLLDQAEDLSRVVRAIEADEAKGARAPVAARFGEEATIVAHGEGCLTALVAVRRYALRPRRLFLVSCMFTGTYLESWGRLILGNMERSGARPAAVAEARRRMERFAKEMAQVPARSQAASGVAPPGLSRAEQEQDRDLAAFERALEFLRGPDALAWTREAARLSFVEELDFALRLGLRVVLVRPAFDTEVSADEEQAIARQFGGRALLSIQPLPRTNHFLKEQKQPAGGAIARAVWRANPFAPLSAEFLALVLEDAR